jgi:hypothetical protein
MVQDRGVAANQGAGNTVERLTAEVNELKKRYNELKHISKVRQYLSLRDAPSFHFFHFFYRASRA